MGWFGRFRENCFEKFEYYILRRLDRFYAGKPDWFVDGSLLMMWYTIWFVILYCLDWLVRWLLGA